MTIKEMKARIAAIDAKLDNDAITETEFDALEEEARRLTAELGKMEQVELLRNVRTLSRVSEWETSFLDSFSCGTRKVTNKQAEIFKRFNHSKPFIYNGRRFDCNGPDYRSGFGTLLVTSISVL